MNNLKNVFMQYYRYIESIKDKTKTATKIFKNIDLGYFNLILSDKCFWYETTYWNIPAYVHKNIKKYMLKTYNVQYLYDLYKI